MPQNFWCKRITHNDRLGIIPGMTLRITSLALTETIAKPDQRTSVAITFKAESAGSYQRLCIGSLGPGRYEQSNTEINLSRGEQYVLEVHGPNVVDLAGYHYDEVDEQDLPRRPTLMENVESVDKFFSPQGTLVTKRKRYQDGPDDNEGQGKRPRDASETREDKAGTTQAPPRGRKKKSNAKQDESAAESQALVKRTKTSGQEDWEGMLQAGAV